MKYLLRLFFVVVFLPGCGRYIRWGKTTFKQADKACYDSKQACDEVQTKNVLIDMFSTLDVITVMPCSNVIIEAHERMRAESIGESSETTKQKINDLCANNQKQSIFFVALYGTKKDWSFSLCKEGTVYEPIIVERAILDRWDTILFGAEQARFKKYVYRIVFETPFAKPYVLQVHNGQYKVNFD